VNFKVAITEV